MLRAIAKSKTAKVRYEGDNILVAINNSNEQKRIFVGTQWDNSYSLFDEKSVDGFVNLPPYRYTLLSKKEY